LRGTQLDPTDQKGHNRARPEILRFDLEFPLAAPANAWNR
jgi:hypothetical protein